MGKTILFSLSIFGVLLGNNVCIKKIVSLAAAPSIFSMLRIYPLPDRAFAFSFLFIFRVLFNGTNESKSELHVEGS